MPNWCFTTYRITGGKKSVQSVYNMLEKLKHMDKPRVENGFGNLWLGCIVDYLGGDWNEIICRGEVTDYEMESENCLKMNVEVAWAESPSFRHFLEEKIPNITVYHYSEEPDMAGYWTNDPNDRFKYYLDSCYVDIDSDYFENLDGVAKYLSEFGIDCEPTVASIQEAIDKYQDEHDEEEYLALHEIEYIND